MKAGIAFIGGACAIVVASLALAFGVVGPPSRERLYAADEQRVEDVRLMKNRLRARFGEGGALPSRLPAVMLGSHDPITGRPYDYERLDGDRFRLCVTYAFPSEDDSGSASAYESSERHPAGRVCRTIDVRDDRGE